MPPDASSRPATGLNFIEISTSPYGPPGATMTLNSFFVARCINTFRPLGAPSISSTTHWPSTVVQLAIPCVSKSNFSSGTLSGTLISVTPARAGAPRVTPYVPSAASAALNRPRRDIVRLCIAASYLRPARLRLLLLQDRVETVEDRHAALEQVVVVRRGLGERADGEIHARRLVACELAVVQIRLVDDLRDELDPPVLEPESLDQRLERAVLAVMPEIRAEHVEGDALAGGIRRIREGKLRVGIAEALDEPGRRDAVDPEQGRLAAKRLDLLDQPLEQLGRLRRLRQDPAGAPQPDGAHALELPPDPDAVPGRLGGQGREQGQPAHRAHSNACYITSQALHSRHAIRTDQAARADPRARPVLPSPRPPRVWRSRRARRSDGARNGRRKEMAHEGGDAGRDRRLPVPARPARDPGRH